MREGVDPRSAGYRPVALHRTRAAHRLASRGAAGPETSSSCLMARPWEPGTFWNVNLPHLGPDDPDPEVVFCPLDPSPLPLSYRIEDGQAVYTRRYQSRVRQPGCDVDVCFGGQIAVTRIRVDGHEDTLTQPSVPLVTAAARGRPIGRLWPTRDRTCHNGFERPACRSARASLAAVLSCEGRPTGRLAAEIIIHHQIVDPTA